MRVKSDRTGNSFGLLRLVFAALVVLCHARYLRGPDARSPWAAIPTLSGWIAVQGFFAMSGLLLAQSVRRTPDSLVFAWHRLLRLGPALWASLLFVLLVIVPLVVVRTDGWGTLSAAGPSALTYFWHNAFQPGLVPTTIARVFVTNPTSPYINGSLWTLRYEAACYVIMGATGLVGLWRGRVRWIWWTWALSAIGLACDALPFHGAVVFTSEGRQLVPTFLGGAAIGTLSEAASVRICRWPVLLALGAGLLAAYSAGFAVRVAALLVPPLVAGLGRRLPGRNLETRLGGDYSYGLYVGSYPLQQTLLALGFRGGNLTTFFLFSMLVAGAYAIASWHFIEAPALKLKHHRPWASLRWRPASFRAG